MGDVSRIGPRVPWGPAERSAIDRCLAVPGLAHSLESPRPPPRLSRTIESEIIPRLLLAHLGETVPQDKAITTVDVRDVAAGAMQEGLTLVMRRIDAILARGQSVEAVFLELLGPAARLLGDMWEDDLCSFAEVTMGLSRLQQVLRELAPRFEEDGRPVRRGRILLTTVPGDQHSFGVSMLECFFRRAGWDVSAWGPTSRDDLIRCVRDEWLDILGLSLASDTLYGIMPDLVRSVRAASQNPSLAVLVGGRYFADNPGHVAEAGADRAAFDAPDALRQAESCLSRTLARC